MLRVFGGWVWGGHEEGRVAGKELEVGETRRSKRSKSRGRPKSRPSNERDATCWCPFVTLFVGCFVAHHSIHHSSLSPSMDVSSFFTRLLQVPKHTPSTARPDHLEDFDSAWQSIKVRKGQSKRNNRTYSSSNNRKLWSIRMRGNWCGKMSLNQFNEETRWLWGQRNCFDRSACTPSTYCRCSCVWEQQNWRRVSWARLNLTFYAFSLTVCKVLPGFAWNTFWRTIYWPIWRDFVRRTAHMASRVNFSTFKRSAS